MYIMQPFLSVSRNNDLGRIRITFLSDSGFPTFTAIDCKTSEVGSPSYEFCVKVIFPNDNNTDYLLLKKDEYFQHNYLYEGKLKKEGVEVTVTLADKEEDPPETYTKVLISPFVHFLHYIRL